MGGIFCLMKLMSVPTLPVHLEMSPSAPDPTLAGGAPTCRLDDRGNPVHPAGEHGVAVEYLHLHSLHHILPLVIEWDLRGGERVQGDSEPLGGQGRAAGRRASQNTVSSPLPLGVSPHCVWKAGPRTREEAMNGCARLCEEPSRDGSRGVRQLC